MKQPIIILSHLGHTVINKLAWKLTPEPSYKERQKPSYKRPWLWKLNDWVARPSVDDYVYRKTGKTRKEWEKDAS